jgi:broad specificity phosphatase PhoE
MQVRTFVPVVLSIASTCAVLAQEPVNQPPPAGATTVVLVRHAEKADDTKDPELSPLGQARAQALAAAVSGLAIDAVIVSDTRRAALTGATAAKARGLTPVVVPTSGGAASHVKAVVDAVRALRPGSAVLVVGHSNTVPLIVAALGGPELPALCEKEFAPLFVLELAAGGTAPRLLRARYGAPDPPGASECGP